jgi:Domain of unknown function (DUF222)
MPEEVSQVSLVPPPASTTQALGMLESAMGYLSAADATAMATQNQAQCLQALERVSSMGTAARASILAAFTSGQGYCADADYSPRAWLIHKTKITRGAAAGHTAWARRTAAHPQVVQALAGGQMSESFGRTICQWTDKLPQDCRPAADAILVTAARAGMDLPDLAGLAAELYERSRPDVPDEDPDRAFEDRAVRLETTFQGAGVLGGDLTPECAAVVGAVLDALSAPAGAEDTRTHEQRYHDALQEAMRSLCFCITMTRGRRTRQSLPTFRSLAAHGVAVRRCHALCSFRRSSRCVQARLRADARGRPGTGQLPGLSLTVTAHRWPGATGFCRLAPGSQSQGHSNRHKEVPGRASQAPSRGSSLWRSAPTAPQPGSRSAKQEPVRRTGSNTGKQVHSFLATSGPVMRASSGKVAAMMPRAARIPPAVMR